jgi:hypothetical protein
MYTKKTIGDSFGSSAPFRAHRDRGSFTPTTGPPAEGRAVPTRPKLDKVQRRKMIPIRSPRRRWSFPGYLYCLQDMILHILEKRSS